MNETLTPEIWQLVHEGRIVQDEYGRLMANRGMGRFLNILCVVLFCTPVTAVIGLFVCGLAIREWIRVRRVEAICRSWQDPAVRS